MYDADFKTGLRHNKNNTQNLLDADIKIGLRHNKSNSQKYFTWNVTMLPAVVCPPNDLILGIWYKL